MLFHRGQTTKNTSYLLQFTVRIMNLVYMSYRRCYHQAFIFRRKLTVLFNFHFKHKNISAGFYAMEVMHIEGIYCQGSKRRHATSKMLK